jgi:urease accessory protein
LAAFFGGQLLLVLVVTDYPTHAYWLNCIGSAYTTPVVSYDLGEDLRVVLSSGTEGEDKPLEYPTIFNTTDVAMITKMDPAKAVGFQLDWARANIEAVRPGMQILDVSAKTGQGMSRRFDLIEERRGDSIADLETVGTNQVRRLNKPRSIMNSQRRTLAILIVPLLLLAWPTCAYAHPGLGDVNGIVSGLAHPLGGLDHLCAMIGVGLWAGQRGGRAVWLIPAAFLGVMAFGGLLGMLAVGLPFVEPGILASVCVLGILIALAIRLPLLLSVLLVGLFALFHGHAHGTEMSHTMSGLLYGAGFLASTALLNGIGLCVVAIAQQHRQDWLVRAAGTAVALCGVALTVTM